MQVEIQYVREMNVHTPCAYLTVKEQGLTPTKTLWRGFSQCLCDLGLPSESDFEGRVCFLLTTIFASCLCLRVGGVSRCSLSIQRD